MGLDPNPLFRRIIMPWYDSTLLCLCLLAAMAAVVFFSVIGIVVANEVSIDNRHAWMPWTLLLLGVLAGLSVAGRLIRRKMPPRGRGKK